MTTHVNRGVEPRMNSIESVMTSKLRDTVRMNHSIVLSSRVGVPSEFFYGVYKVLSTMGVTSREKA